MTDDRVLDILSGICSPELVMEPAALRVSRQIARLGSPRTHDGRCQECGFSDPAY